MLSGLAFGRKWAAIVWFNVTCPGPVCVPTMVNAMDEELLRLPEKEEV